MSEANTVIEAGAGTGKTTRLVKVVLHALLVRRLPLETVVALTFTKKAAGELKERISLSLQEILQTPAIDLLRLKPWWPSPEAASTLDDLKTLAATALSVIDRAEISTIHSFAFSLLKRFPLASGIDPGAEIDDKGLRFDDLFRQEWPRWLTLELAEGSAHEAQWLELLSYVTLFEIEEVARRLADFTVPLEKLPLDDADLPKRLAVLHEETRALIKAHGADLNAGKVATACEEVLGIGAAGEWEKLETLSAETLQYLHKDPGSPMVWSSDVERLVTLQQAAKNVVARGDRVIALLTLRLAPFAALFRTRLLSEGCLTHSALLFLSKELVKTQSQIRERLKETWRLILIDEFQDTDPLQAELLVFLSEKPGHTAPDWRQVTLENGKLFTVGDPKQSIYRFRGADIAVYEDVSRMIVDQGGVQDTLRVNYRSQSQILAGVNTAFETIIQEIPRISPPYIPVESYHPQDPASPLHDVQLWLAISQQEQTVEEAQTTEAEAIAAWIQDHVQQRTLNRRDVALIFRTYSPMDRYIEALRRYDIPFVVESERYFYTTPEVTDFINLLHASDDPSDDLSLVGFLRSPLMGLPDETILRHRQAGTLEQLEGVRWVRRIGERLKREPLTDVMADIFENTFLLELAARSYHGDQTAANLEKLRRLLETLASQGITTMGALLTKLQEFFDDDKLEGENPLADENYDAVKLMTIHKAKGLEFRAVFLPSLHSELIAHRSDAFLYDWRTGALGLRVGTSFCNLDKFFLDEEARRREVAEQNRLLYVAMTRAKEHLVLSGGIHLKSSRKATFLKRLTDAWQIPLAEAVDGLVTYGHFNLTVRRLQKVEAKAEKPGKGETMMTGDIDPKAFAKVWADRTAQRKQAEATIPIKTPTGVIRDTWTVIRDDENTSYSSPTTYHVPLATTSGTGLGTLLHLFLQHWDFSARKCDMPSKLRQLAKNDYDAAIIDRAERILVTFMDSPDFKELQSSDILGREIPFFYEIKPEGVVRDKGPVVRSDPNASPRTTDHLPLTTSLMRGTMDIIYRTKDGTLVVGDYKSGATRAEHDYQAQAYLKAIHHALGEEATFKIISLV